MQESSVYKHLVETAGKEYYERGIQLGTEQGARQSTIRDLFAVLEFKFDGRAVQALRPAIESIQDLKRLERLHNEALRAETFEAFAHTLSTNGNKE